MTDDSNPNNQLPKGPAADPIEGPFTTRRRRVVLALKRFCSWLLSPFKRHP